MQDARCTPAFFCCRELGPALHEVRRRTQLIQQLGEAFIVTPASAGGAQASHLIVGRRRPVGVDRSRILMEEHVAGEVRLCILEHSEGPNEAPPSSVPGQHVVGRADHEGGCGPQSLEERLTVGTTTRVNDPAAGHNAALLLTLASIESCRRPSSSRRRASARAAITLADGRVSRPCSRRTR